MEHFKPEFGIIKFIFRDKLRSNHQNNKKIKPGNLKVESFYTNDKSKSESRVADLDSLNHTKSTHREIFDKVPRQAKTDDFKLPKFGRGSNKSQTRSDPKKYNTGIPSLSHKRIKSNGEPEERSNKKLRKAQFELKKLKEEIVKKNIEVLAMTKDIKNYESGDQDSSMKRKTTLSPPQKLHFQSETLLNKNKHMATGKIFTDQNKIKVKNQVTAKPKQGKFY